MAKAVVDERNERQDARDERAEGVDVIEAADRKLASKSQRRKGPGRKQASKGQGGDMTGSTASLGHFLSKFRTWSFERVKQEAIEAGRDIAKYDTGGGRKHGRFVSAIAAAMLIHQGTNDRKQRETM